MENFREKFEMICGVNYVIIDGFIVVGVGKSKSKCGRSINCGAKVPPWGGVTLIRVT